MEARAHGGTVTVDGEFPVIDGDDVLLLKPSYAMYRFYADVAGASVRTFIPCSTVKAPIA